MPVILQGIKIKRLTVTPDETNDKTNRLEGTYELIGTNGKILAVQEFGRYNSVQFELSTETKQLLDTFVNQFTNEINQKLGFT